MKINRGVEQWQLAGLITRRLQVRVLPPLQTPKTNTDGSRGAASIARSNWLKKIDDILERIEILQEGRVLRYTRYAPHYIKTMYTTIAEILEYGLSETELIHLLNDESRDTADIDLDDPDDVLVKRAAGKIKSAEDYIDGFLRGRFTLPLTTVPGIIKDWANDISIHKMHEHRHRKDMPESLIIKFKEITKLLQSVQSGDYNPGIEEAVSQADVIIKTKPAGNTKIFTDEKLKDF